MTTTLSDKELLLREIHHRIKNNLHIISSLLSLQAEHSASKTPIEIIKASQDRITSLALLHESLDQSEDLSTLDIKTYIESIGHRLHQAHTGYKTRFSCKMQAQLFPFDTLLPLGLIVNELVSNSLRHGRSAEQELQVTINGLITPQHYEIIISDNGPGFSPAPAPQPDALGLKLVKGLASQIDAKMDYYNNNGSRFIFIIPLPNPKTR